MLFSLFCRSKVYLFSGNIPGAAMVIPGKGEIYAPGDLRLTPWQPDTTDWIPGITSR